MAFTKVVGPGIHTLSNILSHNINSSGIITATKFVGPFDNAIIGGGTTISSDGINVTGIVTATGLDINGNGDISGNLVVGGNLTANGDFTTLNTTLREVELLRVDASDGAIAGIITQSGSGHALYVDGTTILGNSQYVPTFNSGTQLVVAQLSGNTNSVDMTILGGRSGKSIIRFGDQDSNNRGSLQYHHSNESINFYNNGNGTTPKLTIANGGSVGIGSDAPLSTMALDVVGSIRYSNQSRGAAGSASEPSYAFYSDHDSGMYRGGTNILSFATAGTKRITVLADGKVGIGSGTPSALLDVNKGTQANIQIKTTDSGSINSMSFSIGSATNQIFSRGANVSTPRNFIIGMGSTEVVRIDTTGNIILKDPLAQGNSLVHYIQATDINGAGQYYFGMLSTGNQDLYVTNSKEANLRFQTNGSTRWKIDGDPGHLIPETAGAVNIGSASAEIGNVYLANSKALFLGSNQAGDLYNDGTDTYFRNSASNGQMLIRSNGNILISNYAANEYRIKTFNNGAVELYYDQSAHATAKLATTATGVSVHGEVEASQDFPVIKPVLDFNFAAEKKLDPRFTFYRRGTASYVDKKGIVRYASSNEPRFDHHPTSGASLGFLVEKQQSNYQPYSVDMSQGANNNAVTVINDAAISPDGTKNASKIIGSDNQSTSQRLGWSTQNVNNSNYTMWSIWLKSEETSCIIQVYSNTYTFGSDYLNVELADGTVGGHTNIDGNFRYNLEKYPNKWWRLSWGGNGSGNAGGMYVAVVPAMNSARAADTGSAHGKVWYAWGLQEEVSTESRIATSYIPTYGSTATRYGDYAQMQDDDFDDFFDRFQGTVINEHSNALQSYGGGGSGWEFQNNQFQTNLITSTGSGYAHGSYPGCHASVFGDRGSNGSGSGSGSDYVQAYGPNDADAQNAPTNTGNGRYPNDGIADYTRYYRTWIDAMSYDVTPSENILRVATGGASSYVGGNTQNISLANISKLELGNGAAQLGYSSIYGRIKRWVYYDKVFSLSQLRNLTSQLPQSYL